MRHPSPLIPRMAAAIVCAAAATLVAAPRPAAAQVVITLDPATPANQTAIRPTAGTLALTWTGTVDLRSFVGFGHTFTAGVDSPALTSLQGPPRVLNASVSSGLSTFLSDVGLNGGFLEPEQRVYTGSLFSVSIDGETDLGLYDSAFSAVDGLEDVLPEFYVNHTFVVTQLTVPDSGPSDLGGDGGPTSAAQAFSVAVVDGAAAPEPGSLALLALPLAGAVAARRRRAAK